MRIKRAALLAFLLVLYMGPVILSPYSMPSTIPTDKNILSSDPWFDNGWLYRREVFITGSTSASTDHQVEVIVSYESGMQADFDDIRFTDNDQVTLLDCWLENKTDSTEALFWVEVKDSLATSTSIYMYFGNSTATSVSDGPSTFPFFDDFNDASLNTTLWYNWLTGGSTTEAGGLLTVTGGAGASEETGGKFKYGQNYAYEYNVSFSAEQDIVSIGFDDRSDDGSVEGAGIDACTIVYDSSKLYQTKKEGVVNSTARSSEFTEWSRLSIRRNDGVITDDIRVYENGSLSVTLDEDIPTDDCGVWVYARNSGSSTMLDFVFVRKWVLTNPEVSSFGSVESPPSWHIIEECELTLWIPTDEGPINRFLLFVGLAMMPLSTIYLVAGGKKGLTQDRVFYFILMFMVGFGLVVGVTM